MALEQARSAMPVLFIGGAVRRESEEQGTGPSGLLPPASNCRAQDAGTRAQMTGLPCSRSSIVAATLPYQGRAGGRVGRGGGMPGL
jgi:hypothetical protein